MKTIDLTERGSGVLLRVNLYAISAFTPMTGERHGPSRLYMNGGQEFFVEEDVDRISQLINVEQE